jgi:single-strand DNA-binding protein
VAAGDVTVTVVGNLTNDPELRFTPSGAAVASFTVASSPRVLDKATNEWKDGDPLYMRCSVWRQYAENVAETLTKGTRVIVTGRLKQRSYETREGEKRTVVEMDVEDVGPALRYATAKVTRAARGEGGGGYGGPSSSGGSDASEHADGAGPTAAEGDVGEGAPSDVRLNPNRDGLPFWQLFSGCDGGSAAARVYMNSFGSPRGAAIVARQDRSAAPYQLVYFVHALGHSLGRRQHSSELATDSFQAGCD